VSYDCFDGEKEEHKETAASGISTAE